MTEAWDDILEEIFDAIKAPVFEIAYRIHYLTAPTRVMDYTVEAEVGENFYNAELIEELTEILRRQMVGECSGKSVK